MLLLYILGIICRCPLFIHLHSTMLLLYEDHPVRDVQKIQIYIPLCFYFMCNFYVHIWIFLIYIPLCFYFIKLFPCTYIIAHYLHSTMLLLYPCRFPVLHHSISKFTFHYASTISAYLKSWDIGSWSIYIPLCFYYIQVLHHICRSTSNLHSTMLLLYLRYRQ